MLFLASERVLASSPNACVKVAANNLPQPNQELFEQTLYDISTPSHPSYGQHMKRDELKALLRPTPQSTEAVLKWLKDSGISAEEIEDDGEWINFIATISQAEEMMDTTFETYQSTLRDNVYRTRTLHYSIPEELHDHIDMIQPTTRFGQIRAERSLIKSVEVLGKASAQAVNLTACNTTITPQCLKDLYNIGDYTPKASKKNLLGVNGFLEQYARFDDLKQFAALYAPYIKKPTFTWTSVNGKRRPNFFALAWRFPC